jgi:hypothetical protein
VDNTRYVPSERVYTDGEYEACWKTCRSGTRAAMDFYR